MRLITHNMLKCNIRGIENGYPLIIQASATEVVPADFDKDTIKEMLKRIQWEALRKAAENLSISTLDNIEVITPDLINSEEFLRNIHHLLFELHVLDGALICPESGREFPIKDGIPNMLLHEDEV